MSMRFSFLPTFAFAFALSILQAGCGEADPDPQADEAIEKVYQGALTVSQAQGACNCRLEIVRLGGTVVHFGLDLTQVPPVSFPFQAPVPGTRVWIAEAPVTRLLNVRSGADGKWNFPVVKLKGRPLSISFVYENPGYVTTKAPVIDVADAPITDLAVQFPTEAFVAVAKAQLEQQVGALIGAPYPLRNLLVTTVGKSWASIYSPDLPHGDPGVHVDIAPAIAFPASLGPIYFNEEVAPDPTLTATSVDGGVLFGNLAAGSVTITASKAPFTYAPLTFRIDDAIPLYVASPPHATQGTNSSPPGQP